MSKKYARWEKSGIKKDSQAYVHRSSEIAKFTFLRLLPTLQTLERVGEMRTFRTDSQPHADPFLYGDFKSFCQIAHLGLTMMAFGNDQYPYGFRFNLDNSIDVVINPDFGHANIPHWVRKNGNISFTNGYFREIESFPPSDMQYKEIPSFMSFIKERKNKRQWPILVFGNLTSPIVSVGYEVPWENQIVNSRSVKRKDRIRQSTS